MSLTGPPADGVDALAELAAAFDRFAAESLTGLDRDSLLARVRGFEQLTRRFAVADHAHIVELEARGVAHDLAVANTAVLLRQLLGVSPWLPILAG